MKCVETIVTATSPKFRTIDFKVINDSFGKTAFIDYKSIMPKAPKKRHGASLSDLNVDPDEQPSRGYYYDDAYGYEKYQPEDDDDDNENERLKPDASET